MSDDSDIEDRRRKHNMSSKRSKGKGKRSLSTGNERAAKKRRLETVGKKETSTDKTKKRGQSYGCQLCGTTFNNVSTRNGHYSGKHKVHDEKLLFFPNGTGLVESSLEHQISLKPDWFKAAVRYNRRTTVCKLCEVDLDTEAHLHLHYKDIHKVTRMDVLSQLIRLKTTDIKKVAVTHKCSSCTVSFDDAQELEMHMKSAHGADYKRCDYCNIRVQIDVYNAHIQKKHADMIDKRVETRSSVVEVPEPKPNKAKREKKVKAVKKVETPKREVIKDSVKKTKYKKVADWCSKVPADKKTALTLYLCKACKLATISYDNAVCHAQDHILNLPPATNHCEICKLNFGADFVIHKKMHLTNEDLDADSFRLFPYDYRLLMSHKWYDMFANSPKTMANKVRSTSIYFPSRCIRLKIEKDSKEPSERFTLFMCVTCKKYVDPPSIELHVERQGYCANQLSCYLCYRCQRQFFSQKARDQHISTHETPDACKRYRTVLFNDRNDLICNRKLLQAGMNIVVTNNERVNLNTTEDSESVETDIIAVVNEALYKTDNVEKIENDVLNELYPTVTDNDVVADIYVCKCGLSFDRLEFLCKHWKICSPPLKLVTKTCKCGLVFDKQNYDYHCTVHSNGFTTFTVNEVSIRVKNSIDVRHIKNEFINTTESNNSEIIYNGMEEDNIVTEGDVNKDGREGRILQNLQVVNIANVKEEAANNLLHERQTFSNYAHQPLNIENYQQSSNEHGSAEYIVKTQDDSKTVYEEFETYKVIVISNNVSQNELQNQEAMAVTDASISVQNDDVPDNTNVCSSNADENQCMVDTTMEIDLQQGTYQDKNLLKSTIKKQGSVNNFEPEKVPVSPSLEENKLSDNVMNEILHENVLHNANSVNEVSGVVKDILQKDNTEITKEGNTRDEAMIHTQEDKAEVLFVDNQNNNTGNDQQTSNEHDKQVKQTIHKEFEDVKVLTSNDISNNVSQTELENQVAMDVTDTSISIQNDDVPDNTNICSSNANENQSMVDTTMEIDLQQGTYQDKNLLISNAKEQDYVENSEPEKDPISLSLEENKLSDITLSQENVLHNANIVNEVIGVVEYMLDKAEIKEINTNDEVTTNTEGDKVYVQFVDNKNKNTEDGQQTSNEHDNIEFLGKTQSNSQTNDKEFEADKVLISNDISNNVSQIELENQVVMDVTGATISIQNDDVPDNKNVCNKNADENQSVVDTSMEIDLHQEMCQDKNLLISNTKEQVWVEIFEPEKDLVSPSLQENEVRDSVMKEIPHENVIHNTNSVNEDSDVVDDKLFKTEIREESNTYDEAVIETQGAKADIECDDNQNKSAENYEQTSYANDASISIQNEGVPDNGNVCNNNRDENQSMVDTTMEIDLQQGTYQDNNLLISNTKEQGSVDNFELEKVPVSPSLEENKLSDSVMKEFPYENVLHNANSVNEVSGVVEDILDKREITKEGNTRDEAMIHTQEDKADVLFVDNKNNTGNDQQISNEHDKQVSSQTIDKEFEAVKVLISNDISNNVSQTELENRVAMVVTDASITVQNDDVPDKNVCSSNADENQSMVDTTMEIDLQQDQDQNTNLLISNTKEQDCVENSYPEKDLVSTSLEENKLSVNEVSDVVEDMLDNTEIKKEINKHDVPMTKSQEDKADNVSQNELENQVAMDVRDTSISIQSDDVPDNTNVCSSNADENQSMVDTSVEIDLQQGTYQNRNLLKSNIKEQGSVNNFEPEKVPLSPSLEENKLSDSVMKEIPRENVLHNANSVNEVSGVVEDMLDNTEITKEVNTRDEVMIHTQEDKADILFVDNKNNNTGIDQQTSYEHDKQVNSQTIDKEFEVVKVLISNDISNNVSQTELKNRVAMDVTDTSISMQNDDVPDNTNICSSNADENQSMADTSMEIDLQQGTYQDKNLLISNTKEQDCLENSNPEKDLVSPSLEEHKLSVNEVSDVVENMLDNTEITIGINKHDVPMAKTQEDKAAVQFLDNRNNNTGNDQQTSNEKVHLSPSLEENKHSDSVMKEIPHENVLHIANSVNKVSDVFENKPDNTEIIEKSNTHDEAVIKTQELWGKEADVLFVDSENKHTERNYITSNDHPKYEEMEREHIRKESAEMVYSEEELLDGPEDPDFNDDSLLTDDEDF